MKIITCYKHSMFYSLNGSYNAKFQKYYMDFTQQKLIFTLKLCNDQDLTKLQTSKVFPLFTQYHLGKKYIQLKIVIDH